MSVYLWTMPAIVRRAEIDVRPTGRTILQPRIIQLMQRDVIRILQVCLGELGLLYPPEQPLANMRHHCLEGSSQPARRPWY